MCHLWFSSHSICLILFFLFLFFFYSVFPVFSSLPFPLQHAGRTTQNLVFPVTVRLMRVQSILIRQFHPLLSTECEIFLSMLVRFMDPDKPYWQRVLAIEVTHDICQDPDLVRSFCRYYDMQSHNTKIFRDLINAVGGAVQSIYQSATEKPAISLPNTTRLNLLDMLEKTEAPAVRQTKSSSVLVLRPVVPSPSSPVVVTGQLGTPSGVRLRSWIRVGGGG